jgi:hypothetical protein
MVVHGRPMMADVVVHVVTDVQQHMRGVSIKD